MKAKKPIFTDVYVANVPDEIGNDLLFPSERQNEVLACANDRARRQKYYVWKLLGYALQRSCGLEMDALAFHKEKSGKWTVPNCYFSLSHSYNAVAVAVSNRPIGVDLELISDRKEGILQKTLTAAERAEYETLPPNTKLEYLIKTWTQKESFFKMTGDGLFRPQKIAVDKSLIATKKFQISGEEYVLSVAAENVTGVRRFEQIDL